MTMAYDKNFENTKLPDTRHQDTDMQGQAAADQQQEKKAAEMHSISVDLKKINSKDFDFYTATNDYIGSTIINKNHEIVNYRNSSTVRIWYNEQLETFPVHWHNSLEIILPVSGHYCASIDKTTYCIREGEIFFIPPGELHSVYPPPESNGTRFVYLLDLSAISRLKDFAGIQPLLSTPFLLNQDTSPETYKDIFDLLMQMQTEYFNRNLFSELSIYSLLMTIFVKLGISYSKKFAASHVRSGKQREYFKQFNDLLAYIDEHYMDPLTLEDTASLMGFSKFHFSRLFKEHTGYTFCDYINYRRIKATEELLPRAELSITEIAMQVGFSSISTFNRLFRVYKKCSPSEYRSKLSFHTLKKG